MTQLEKIKAEINRRIAERVKDYGGAKSCTDELLDLVLFIEFLEQESFPKIKGWVARDLDGELHLFSANPIRNKSFDCFITNKYHTTLKIADDLFPDLKWESEPIEVELLIRKI